MAPLTVAMVAMRIVPVLLLLANLTHGLVTRSHVLRKQITSTSARGFNNFFKKPEPKKETPPEPEYVDGAYDVDDPVEKIFTSSLESEKKRRLDCVS